MNIYSLSVLLFSFGVFLIAFLAFAKRGDAIAIRFTFFSFSVCGWGFLYGIWTSQGYSAELTLALIRASEVFAVFIPITWVHFILVFVGKKEPFRHFYAANYAAAMLMAALAPTPLFFSGVHEIPVFHYYKTAAPVFYVFMGIFFTLVPYAFYHLLKAYRQASTEHLKAQLFYLLIGWLVSFGAGSSTFFPVFKITAFLPALCLMPLYPVFVGLALIRYGLFDAEQMAQAFQREKLTAIGTVAASLNHELRNPFFMAKGKAETFLDQMERGLCPVDSKTRETVQGIYAHLTRASEIMQKFSDFAKPFYQETRKEKVVVREAFENVLQLVSGEFEMNKIRVNVVPSNGLSVQASPRHFEEILFNLITNACHSMEQGGELTLSACQPNGKVIVEVSDTGSGIAKDRQKKIFEPFYTTKTEKGTGLGLYITKQLVERNGGRISVKSKPGAGTTFRLELAGV